MKLPGADEGIAARTGWVESPRPVRANATEGDRAQLLRGARVNLCGVALTWQSIAQEERQLETLRRQAGQPPRKSMTKLELLRDRLVARRVGVVQVIQET